ncbi:hypothetical protein BBJ29_008461 [Phytophthora kernoviae]|uniref:Uncharacterized protein n=1 Tax=Phytophthora kernoviae TaxID=325452 RepID=A0A3F2RDF4_9STRA|nr:hypothetical protein BBJ29_008461 [Phytophthora kernoviae]RLN53884.1 hypothetical protein BBP00_00009156 [Phytophthora kernoviae]
MYGHQMPLLYVELDKKYATQSGNRAQLHLDVGLMNFLFTCALRTGVGKTNLISRLHKGEFNDEFTSTIGVEFLTHAVHVDNVEVKAQIWDTAGQERFHAMMSTYYRKAAGALLIFDVGNRASLLDVERWLDQLLNVAEPGLHATLVGNKCDIPDEARTVTAEEARQFAAAHHMAYIETSAKTGLNVDMAFHDLMSAIHRARLVDFSENSFSTIELTSTKKSTSFFDCNLF